MPLALDNGSQPYSRAYGYGEMAGKATPIPGSLPLGKGQGLLKSPTVKAGCYYRGNPQSSHFEKPKGFSVWLATFV